MGVPRDEDDRHEDDRVINAGISKEEREKKKWKRKRNEKLAFWNGHEVVENYPRTIKLASGTV